MDYLDGNAGGSTNEYKLPPEGLDTEFEMEFPSDQQLGREMDPSARVWKVYRKEATIVDNALLDGWSNTLNILLIFAGLFSAVATAFVIESYQQLQPDNAAYAATALYILVAASNHSKSLDLPARPGMRFIRLALDQRLVVHEHSYVPSLRSCANGEDHCSSANLHPVNVVVSQ